jgi:elongation factor G
MHYKILKPERKVRLRYTLAAAVDAVGKFVRQSGPPGRYAIVALQMEPVPVSKGIDPKVEVIWDVHLTKFSGDVSKIIFDSIVAGIMEFTDPDQPETGALTACVIRISNAEWHPVDSNELSYRVATTIAIKDCLARSGVVNL